MEQKSETAQLTANDGKTKMLTFLRQVRFAKGMIVITADVVRIFNYIA